MLGSTLTNRYRLDRLIGSGGMAAVYQAYDLSLRRIVAVKLLRFDSAGIAPGNRYGDEVEVLARLNHHALVTLYDAGTAVIHGIRRSFIVTEYVPGTDLRSRLDEGPMSPGEVARLGADLCEALHYMKAQGIIHRDIKPANVLLAPSDFHDRTTRAKLADFGIARLFNSAHRTQTGTVVGTAGYLSPEQAAGLPVSPAADVYSLGLVLLECLTGEHSYPGTAVESAMARLQRQPEVPDWLGVRWCEVLTGMTAREAEDRLGPADAADLLVTLIPAAAERPKEWAGSAEIATQPVPAPTALLPAGPPPEPPASPLARAPARAQETSHSASPAGGPPDSVRSPRHSRRWPVLLTGLLVALLTAGAVLFLVPGAEPAPEPPAYPAVDGQLGEHFKQLQESVDP